MPACRSSKAGEKERRGEKETRREDDEEEAEEDDEEEEEEAGRREEQGREEQQEVQPRVPGGAQMFIPVDLSSPVLPPSPGAPLRGLRCAPFTSGSCGEGARPRQSGVAERCIYVMRALVARMRSQWRRNRLSVLSDLADGNYDRLDFGNESPWLASRDCDTY